MKSSDNTTIKEVFAAELWKSTMIKNMLEENGIQAFLKDEYAGNIAPFQVTFGGLNPVKVIVSSADYDTALKYIQEFNSENLTESNKR